MTFLFSRRFFLALAFFFAQNSAYADAKIDKVYQLIALHNLDSSMAVGQLFLKQETLFAARALLAQIGKEENLGPDWNERNEHWREAEAALVAPIYKRSQKEFTSLEWLASEWAELTARDFSEQDVDFLIAHFKSEVGAKQSQVIAHIMSVYVMGAYSFSGRLKENVAGAEAELKRMQDLYNAEYREQRFVVRDNPEGRQFGVSQIGRKYMVNSVQKVTGMITRHIDTLARELPGAVKQSAAQARPFVEAFKRGRTG